MPATKRLINLFFSFVLVMGLLPVTAFASPDQGVEEGADKGSEQLSSSIVDADGPSVADGMKDEENTIPSGGQESEEDNVSSQNTLGKQDAIQSDDSAPSEVDGSQPIEFVYIDQKDISVGDTQKVVVSFADDKNADGSTLYYQKQGDELKSIKASKSSDGAALYEIPFKSASDCGKYNLAKVAWTGSSAGESKIASDSDNGYSFSVVDNVVDGDEDGVSAYSLNDNGEITKEDSVADAIVSASNEAVAVSPNNSTSASEGAAGEVQSYASAAGAVAPLALNGDESRASKKMVIALDAGHGGSDSGAVNENKGLYEKTLTLKIAQYCKAELDTYSNVSTYMTRSGDEYVGLSERVKRAVNAGADVFVSFHINSAESVATGFEVWVQNDSSWRYYLHEQSSQLGNSILSKLTALGLTNRGNKESDSKSGNKYADGSPADYLTVLEQSRQNNIPAVLIEHGFINGKSSDQNLLSSESGLKSMGVADAKAIAENYGLYKGAPKDAKISAQAHVANIGWMSPVYDGDTAGTTGRSLSLEALQVKLENDYAKQGSVEVRVHVSDIGWQDWTSGTAGTTGQAKAMEAVQIRLTGELADRYDVWYRVHSAEFGWLGWAKDGESAGSQGYGRAAQAVQVELVEKGGSAPGSTDGAFHEKGMSVDYRAHVADIGWQSTVSDGETAGTTGRGLAMEALRVSLSNQKISGSVEVRVHVSDIGWQDWTSGTAGTTGQAKAMEAVQIRLTGELADRYDVWYRVHSAEFGWLGWAKDGESAGSQGYGRAAQAVQVELVEKGGSAPGSTDGAFHEKENNAAPSEQATPIMGSTDATVDQMVKHYQSTGHSYPSAVYTSKGAPTLRDFCQIVCEEAKTEGVRAEVLFCQAMKETGWLQFGGAVKAEQCNFGGLGATGGSVSGATFSSVREGLRAQVQHLKAYASKDSLVNPCVDPRFNLVSRGIAPNCEDLNGRWAVPGDGYGQDIRKMMDSLLSK